MSSIRTISLGITGGIGCGKSFVSGILQEMGVPVLNTDNEARRLIIEDEILVKSLSELVGSSIIDKDGKLCKSLLSNFIRTSNENAQHINDLVHPVVRHFMNEWIKKQNTPFVAVECALLFETDFDKDFDYTMLVSAPLELRIERVVKRDGKTPDEVRQWISMQMDETEKEKRADFIVVNDGTKDLRQELESMMSKILVENKCK